MPSIIVERLMRITVKQLRTTIRKTLLEAADAKIEGCVQQCLALIPGSTRKACQMGLGAKFMNDIYDMCLPTCVEWKCNPEIVADEVYENLCSGEG